MGKYQGPRISEPYDKPPARSTGLQAPVRLSRALRRINIRHPQRQDASFHLSAQLVEFLEFAIVTSDESRGKSNAALPDYVQQLIREHETGAASHHKELWTLLVFQLWFENYLVE